MVTFVGTLVVSYLVIVLLLYVGQRKLLYFPDKTPVRPEQFGLTGFQVPTARTDDGLDLKFWYRPARSGLPTFVIFHGNGGNLANWSERSSHMYERGYGVVLAEYRGYGGNGGSPTEQGLYMDARAILDEMAGRAVPPSQVILFGESLGSGVAVQMALEGRGAALALVAPYTSVAEVAGHHYSWLPTRFLVKDRFDSLSKIGAVRIPVFVIHGTQDQTIPFEFGMRLAAAANMPKMVRMPVADHNSLWEFDLVEDLIGFLIAQGVVTDSRSTGTEPAAQPPK